MKYQQFIFKDYSFDGGNKLLKLSYSLDNSLDFSETYKFDFDFASYGPEVLNRALQALFIMAGVSYFKAYLPPKIIIEKGSLSKEDAEFFAKTYQRGLGEFLYTNKLDPQTTFTFPVSSTSPKPVGTNWQAGLLVAVGGGKDSLVSVEPLRSQPHTATWSVGHRSQLE